MPKKETSRKKLSRSERRDLDIEIGFLEGVVRRDREYIEALQLLGDDYTRRGSFSDGLKIDEWLAQLRPTDSIIHYNLACSYSLVGDFEAAIRALDKAISLGYRDFKWMARDPDLENLRKQSIYRKIRQKMRVLRVNVQ